MTRALIALGSNLGDRQATFLAAVREIAELDGVELIAASHPIESVALKLTGPDADAPAYLNGVVIVETIVEPHALLAALRAIEAAHGRVRVERWGDRTLDLDLIDFGGQVVDTADLNLPHPRAHERLFVLEPWLEIDAAATLSGTPVAEWIRRVEPVETSRTKDFS